MQFNKIKLEINITFVKNLIYNIVLRIKYIIYIYTDRYNLLYLIL